MPERFIVDSCYTFVVEIPSSSGVSIKFLVDIDNEFPLMVRFLGASLNDLVEYCRFGRDKDDLKLTDAKI